jgi:hypothetical protein
MKALIAPTAGLYFHTTMNYCLYTLIANLGIYYVVDRCYVAGSLQPAGAPAQLGTDPPCV